THGHRGPGHAAISGAIKTHVRPEINHITVTFILKNRIANQARRHIAHCRLPRSPAVIADEKEATARRRIYRGRIDPAGVLTIRQDGVHKTAAEAIVAGYKIFTRVGRDHHAIVVCADVDVVRIAGVNGDRVNLELPRGRDHPGVVGPAGGGTPEPFGSARKNQSRQGWVLEDGPGATRLGRNALNLCPTLTSVFRFVDAAAG